MSPLHQFRPVDVTQVRAALEAAKDDPFALLKYVEKALEWDDETAMKERCEAVRGQLANPGPLSTRNAYKFLFRNAEYFAARGGV